MTALFVQSVSQMIDARTKRLDWTLRHRIPDSIWVTLYLVTAFGMALMGYQTGLSGARSLVPAIWLGLAFSVVILLIAILDRPHRGEPAGHDRPSNENNRQMTNGVDPGNASQRGSSSLLWLVALPRY